MKSLPRRVIPVSLVVAAALPQEPAMSSRCAVLGVALLLSSAIPVAAAPFTATYTFTGSLGDQASEPVDANPVGALFSDITRGPGLEPRTDLDSISSDGWTILDVRDLNDYYEFTISPTAGFALDVTQLAFTFWRSFLGPDTLQIYSSVDNFTLALPFTFFPGTFDTRGTPPISTLSDLTSPLTFRIYAYGATSEFGQFGLGTLGSPSIFSADLVVTGDLTQVTVPVPEPATLMLLGLGLAAGRSPVEHADSIELFSRRFRPARLTAHK